MTKVFVSGCFDILHAGHIRFFEDARALGDHLTVAFASERSLWRHKQRKPSLPDEHKMAILKALSCVDEVVMADGPTIGLDFESEFRRVKPDILAVTEDDQYRSQKERLCIETGTRYVVLPKHPPEGESVSTSQLIRQIKSTPEQLPLRVDFAGGWLDVPRFAREGAFIVNCAVSPLVSLESWPYEKSAGLGGSAAWALLNGHDGIQSELDLGVGWQDPAVIRETGLCAWRSGERPVLHFKQSGDFLRGCMAIYWTGHEHCSPDLASRRREYARIEQAGKMAEVGVRGSQMDFLAGAMRMSYSVQLNEGMAELPPIKGSLASKYCGGGHGGYALYLFSSPKAREIAVNHLRVNLIPIEPYNKPL